ncbi:MAG: hypothetical protein ACK44F_16850, partial [Roseococcus sp.]
MLRGQAMEKSPIPVSRQRERAGNVRNPDTLAAAAVWSGQAERREQPRARRPGLHHPRPEDHQRE